MSITQKQKLLDASIPVIISSMSSIVVHSTNVGFRSDTFGLLGVGTLVTVRIVDNLNL